jgi:hypothetical protein
VIFRQKRIGVRYVVFKTWELEVAGKDAAVAALFFFVLLKFQSSFVSFFVKLWKHCSTANTSGFVIFQVAAVQRYCPLSTHRIAIKGGHEQQVLRVINLM